MTQSTNGVSSTGQAVASDTSVTNPASMMGENDFLKLLVAQLQYQDPMNPTDNSQFMQQQAQFATVEGINNLQSTMKSMQAQNELASSVGLIGKQVSYPKSDGTLASGVVSAVNAGSDGSVTVTVGGVNVDPTTITQVADDPNGTSETQVLSQLLQLLQSEPTDPTDPTDPSSSSTSSSSNSDATDGTGA
jgi:flagellar basal-body rod modification protein FlgD